MMNTFRWIIGIPLALAVAIGVLILTTYFEPIFSQTIIYKSVYVYYHGFINMLCFFLFIFLSVWIVPSKRKYAALTTSLISMILTGLGLYAIISNRFMYGDFSMNILLSYAGIFAGILTGICIGYLVFKNKGWDTEKKTDNSVETY